MSIKEQSQAKWIWVGGVARDEVNQYADFRATFSCKTKPAQSLLRISVDSNFVAIVNGQVVGTGQFGDFPEDRTYSQIDISEYLTTDENVLDIQVHYCGEAHFSYLPGEAGLWFEIENDGEVVSCSDKQVLGRSSPNYTDRDTARMTPQRGFTFHYAVQEEARESQWQPVEETPCKQSPRLRPVKMLDISKGISGAIIAQGLLKRGGGATVAEQMQQDYLSARRPWELFSECPPNSEPIAHRVMLGNASLGDADGAYLLYDLGEESCGFIEVKLNCTSRCVIDIAVGEHVDDLRVRANVGGRNFASRYVAGPSEKLFVHWQHRYAGRYIQLHVTELDGAIELERVGLVVAAYPTEMVGRYSESDTLNNQIWLTAQRTLHLCMFEHYEDCPWREQALYANDSRSQMLSGYYAFKNDGFVRESLDLLLRTTGDDGYQQLCSPMTFEITIPGFTMAWFLALRDYYMYTGDTAYVQQVLPRVKQMLQAYQSTVEDGLLPRPRGKRYWHFYDWAPGLDGTLDTDCTKFATTDDVRFDAPFNALWIMAQRAIAEVAGFMGDQVLASQCLHSASQGAMRLHEKFYDSDCGLYRTYDEKEARPHFAQLTQSLAILAGAGDDVIRSELRRRLIGCESELVPTTLSQSLYKFEAILQEDSLGSVVRDVINAEWSKMLFRGATTFWETCLGGWDFNHAGSLCHGWSGIPVYIFGAYGLGVKPIEPGFKRVKVQPILNAHHIEGVVPTPHGNIEIGLHRDDEQWCASVAAPCEVAVDLAADVKLAQSMN